MAVSRVLAPVIDMVFPPRCPLCGDVLAQQGGLCIVCWGKLAIPAEPACRLCQRPLGPEVPEESGTALCAPCLVRPPRYEGLTAATFYNDASRQLVLAFKHGRRTALGHLLARMMLPRLPVLDGRWLFVPVPLHRWRLWSRGFNQAAILAEHLARATGHAFAPDALLRPKRTPPLGSLDRRARARALAGAITVHPARSALVRDAQIVLVDDVLTSGATTDACVKALLRAGVARVRIACFARVLDDALSGAERGTGSGFPE